MLLELRAENYTVIDRAEVHFGSGLNLLTGETGAGKSILIDALALLLGGKASTDVIRHGSDRATLTCVFEATSGAEALLNSNGIDTDADTVVLRREITASGKGRVFVNNQPATVSLLRQLAPELALVHAQGETTGAFEQSQQRLLLDRFAAINTDSVHHAFTTWRSVSDRLHELETTEQERLRMADVWRFQSREISDAALAAAEEDTQLEAERRVLANAGKLHTAAHTANDLLYEAESSAESIVGTALKHVEELARYDARFEAAAQQLRSAQAAIEDVATDLRSFAEQAQASPERLAAIEDRLAELDRLKRKYGPILADVIQFGAEATERLREVDDSDTLLADLRVEREGTANIYRAAAAKLTADRTAAAKSLERHAEREINELAMQARFSISIRALDHETAWTPHGADQIEYRISTNPGEPMKPLTEIASGGEMSRVMLALKVAVEAGQAASRRRAPLPRTLLFDEIDVGIGGRAAEAVGQKLKSLARAQQVICITHLPQIAAFADQHFVIRKSSAKDRTETRIESIAETARVQEIARMLSGAAVTDTSLRHAEQLLATSGRL